MRKGTLTLAIVVVSMLFISRTTPRNMADAAPRDPGPAVGTKALEIEGTTPNGDPIKLSDFKGKLVMVDFFGDW